MLNYYSSLGLCMVDLGDNISFDQKHWKLHPHILKSLISESLILLVILEPLV